MTDEQPARPRWKALLFPEPERDFPAERQLRTVLRTAHIAAMGVLLGGHFFDVPSESLLGALYWTIGTGLLIVMLEAYGSFNMLFQVRGLAVFVKIGLMCLVPVFWAQRFWLLLAALALGSFVSHTTANIRYYSVLTGRIARHRRG